METDVLVIAGDIASGADATQRFRDWPMPVDAVAGIKSFMATTLTTSSERLRTLPCHRNAPVRIQSKLQTDLVVKKAALL